MKTIEILIIIVNYNGNQYLNKCLKSVAKQTFKNFKVIIVDNASNDGSLENIKLPDHRFQTFPLKNNVGFSSANNIGAEKIESKYIATLNCDAFPASRWLENLYSFAEKYSDYSAFASMQLSYDNLDIIDAKGDNLSFFGIPWSGGTGQQIKTLPSAAEVFSCCAASALYRTKDFRFVNGFDEDFFCYCEDVDLSFRLRLLGRKVLYVPSAVVAHVGRGSSGYLIGLPEYYGHRNALWMHIKNMPFPLIIFTLPAHILFEILAIYKGIFKYIKRKDRALKLATMYRLKGFIAGLIGMKKMLVKRISIQKQRKASVSDILRSLSWSIKKFIFKEADLRPLK